MKYQIDLLNREGINSLNNDNNLKCMLLRVVSHDAFQFSKDFHYIDDKNKNFGMHVIDSSQKNENLITC